MAASTAAGIKYKNRQDMAMIYSKQPCKSAGTFTTNLVKAAPVKWDKNQVTSGADAQAVIKMCIRDRAREGESPVHESDRQRQDPEYRETRETLREVGGTTLQG